jgi:hypothetical protein
LNNPRSSPLAELQERMRRVLTDPRGVQAAAAAHPGLLETIHGAPPLPALERLGVYTEAYFLRILDSLETDFPAVRRALGADDFRRLSADYLSKHPSSSPNISDIGEALPGFTRAHAFAEKYPFLPDLAALEWAVLQVLYTGRRPALDAAALQNIPAAAWPGARLTLDPTVLILETAWPVEKLWEKRRHPEKKGGRTLARASSRYLLLYRDDAGVQLRVIDPPRGFMLRRLKEGLLLGAACDALAGAFPRLAASLPVMDWFAHWLRAGVIKQIVFNAH